MKTALLLFLSFAGFFVKAQIKVPFQLVGDVTKCEEAFSKVYLTYAAGGTWRTDSNAVVEGRYRLTGVLEHPTVAYLRAKPATGAPVKPDAAYYESHSREIFIAPGHMRAISGKMFSQLALTGSEDQQEFKKLQQLLQPLKDSLFRVLGREEWKDTAGLEEKNKKLTELQRAISDVYAGYGKKAKSAPVLLYILQNLQGSPNESMIDTLFDRLPQRLRQSSEGKELEKKRWLVNGKFAPEFSLPDSLGNRVQLSSLRGDYTVLVFWASWCKPCRAEHPGLMKIYETYRSKGIHVVAVSLDDKRDKWLEAVAKDGLRGWVHLSDLKGWRSTMVPLYRIESVPLNFLLDPQGKIVLKNFSEASLERFLATAL